MSNRIDSTNQNEYEDTMECNIIDKFKIECVKIIKGIAKEFNSLKDVPKKIFSKGKIDIPFLVLSMTLLGIGLITLFSASYPSSYLKYGNSFHYISRQMLFAAIGLILMLFASKINTKKIKELNVLTFLFAMILLILVLFYHTNIQTAEGEAFKRYIVIPYTNISIQPSELAKYAFIVSMASYLTNYEKQLTTFKYGALIPGLITFLFVFLIFWEKHVSAMLLFLFMALIMVFAGGCIKGEKNTKLYLAFIAIAVAGIVVLGHFGDKLPGYVGIKIDAWKHKDMDPTGVRWQNNNALYAIGAGSLFGVGLGNSRQKFLYVSEPQNDFIFSIFCEEMGLVGAIIVIGLFCALIVRGSIIACRAKNRFDQLLVIGIICQIGVQTILNILVVTDVIPNTGISLPFFSYGGSSLVVLLCEIGVVLGVSRKRFNERVLEKHFKEKK